MAAHYFLFVSNQIFSNVCKTFQTEIGAGSLKNIIDYTIEEMILLKIEGFNAVDSLVYPNWRICVLISSYPVYLIPRCR